MEYHKLNSDSIERMGISFDLFSHTHTEEHAEVALSILKKLDEMATLSRGFQKSLTIPLQINFYQIDT